MKICFRLGWVSAGKYSRKAFKLPPAFELFEEYLSRIRRFTPAEAQSFPQSQPAVSKVLWLCDRTAGSKPTSSEDIAARIDRLQTDGIKELHIVIGGADGFTAEETAAMKPALRWSFGPLTLPHELAAAVAAEQIYRAFCILNHHPYHAGH